MAPNRWVDAALELYRWGLNVLPAGRGIKYPNMTWERYQHERITEQFVRTRFSMECNYWIVCGKISNVVVLDCDNIETVRWWRARLGDELKYAPRVKTALGYHCYFAWREDATNWSFHGTVAGPDGQPIRLDFEVRSDGGGVVAPPSIRVADDKHSCPDCPHDYLWELLPTLRDDGTALWPPLPTSLTCGEVAGLVAARSPVGSPGAPGAGRSKLTELLQNPPTMGGRNIWMSQVAGHYAKQYPHARDAYDFHFDQAAAMLDPPLPPDELDKTRESIWKAEHRQAREARVDPAVQLGAGETHPLTDMGNARRLVDSYGAQLRYCDRWGKWLLWDGKHWKVDEKGEAVQLTKTVVRAIHTEAATVEDPKLSAQLATWALKSQDWASVRDLMRLAQTEPEIAVAAHELDRDRWLLNCNNGTLDLETGTLHPHKQSDLITRKIDFDYNPDAKAPIWERFLEQVLPDPEIRQFIHRAVGYSLTGMVSEQILLFLYGGGNNGKSVFLSVLTKLLGGYGLIADHELLLASRGSSHPTNVADLQGARMVVCSEVDRGRSFAEARIKQLTSSEDIKARFMARDFFSFAPTFTVWLASNHKPAIRSTDNGIWRRIRLIPFNVRIPVENVIKDLDLKLLETEAEGILAWAVRGCLDWIANGLGTPKAVAVATRAYRSDQDSINSFFNDLNYVQDTNGQVPASQLRKQYTDWCKDNGEIPLNATEWVAELTEGRGMVRTRSKTGFVWRGLAQDYGMLPQ